VQIVTLLTDRRWAGRIIGLWRDALGEPRTIWGRATVDNAAPRYLYLAPDLLDEAKDPGELVTRYGLDAWRAAVESVVCGAAWRTLDLLGPLGRSPSLVAEPAALGGSLEWLARCRRGSRLNDGPPRGSPRRRLAKTLSMLSRRSSCTARASSSSPRSDAPSEAAAPSRTTG
jgi:hypothetical protein